MRFTSRRPLSLLLMVGLCTTPLAVAPSARGEAPTVHTSRHYLIRSDLDPALVAELGAEMDAMYEEYERRLSDFRPPSGPPLDVYLFAKRANYLAFTGRAIENSGGIFMPARRCLAAFYEEQGRDGLRRTLQHEAFHQFAHEAISPDLPVWLNEGLAQLFEEGLWTDGGFSLGQVPPQRVRQLRADLDARRAIDFRTIMSMEPKQWHQRMADPARGAAQYNQAWAMVHYLVTANGTDGQPLRPRFVQWLRSIHAGRDAEVAWNEAFSANIIGFQRSFLDFCRRLTPTVEATLVENVGVLADFLVELNNRGQRFDDVASFREALVAGGYRVQYRNRDMRWSTNADPGAYFTAPDGRPMPESMLYLSPRLGRDLPDIVCQYTPGLRIRATFPEGSGGKRGREVVLEPTTASVQVMRD